MEKAELFDKWFLADSHPFKQGLLNTVKRWSLMFKQHLIDHVHNSLNNLEQFIKNAKSGLDVRILSNVTERDSLSYIYTV